jgi:ribosomal protein S17
MSDAEERLVVLEQYRKKLRELREFEAKLKANRAGVADLVKEFNETEDNLKALQVISST